MCECVCVWEHVISADSVSVSVSVCVNLNQCRQCERVCECACVSVCVNINQCM